MAICLAKGALFLARKTTPFGHTVARGVPGPRWGLYSIHVCNTPFWALKEGILGYAPNEGAPTTGHLGAWWAPALWGTFKRISPKRGQTCYLTTPSLYAYLRLYKRKGGVFTACPLLPPPERVPHRVQTPCGGVHPQMDP